MTVSKQDWATNQFLKGQYLSHEIVIPSLRTAALSLRGVLRAPMTRKIMLVGA
jgi:hypothetical protein